MVSHQIVQPFAGRYAEGKNNQNRGSQQSLYGVVLRQLIFVTMLQIYSFIQILRCSIVNDQAYLKKIDRIVVKNAYCIYVLRQQTIRQLPSMQLRLIVLYRFHLPMQ